MSKSSFAHKIVLFFIHSFCSLCSMQCFVFFCLKSVRLLVFPLVYDITSSTLSIYHRPIQNEMLIDSIIHVDDDVCMLVAKRASSSRRYLQRKHPAETLINDQFYFILRISVGEVFVFFHCHLQASISNLKSAAFFVQTCCAFLLFRFPL